MVTPTGYLRSTRVRGQDPSPRHVSLVHLFVGAYIVTSAVAPLLYGKELIGGLVVALLFASVNNPRIPKTAVFWVFILVSLGTFGTLVGLLHQNPGAISNTTIYILEPLLLGLLLPLTCRTPSDRQVIVWILDIALVGAAIAGVLIYLHLPLGAIAGQSY